MNRRQASRTRWFIALAAVLAVLALVAVQVGAPPATPTSAALAQTGSTQPHGPGGSWRLRFKDDFAGAAVDWETWSDRSSALADEGRGNKSNEQLEWNQRQNCSVSDGRLTITAKPDRIVSSSGVEYDWSSCLLSSSPSYEFRFGYLETRAKLPPERGFWPAFWTWQVAGNETQTETDVFEYYSDRRDRLYLTQHSGRGGQCVLTDLGFDPSAGFHTYGADIHAEGTDFYIDGAKVCSLPGTSTGRTNLMLDLYVYAKVPPDEGTTARMQVDYVRAWTRPDESFVAPKQTLRQASRRARAALGRRFGREFTRRTASYRSTCRRSTPAVSTCDVGWSSRRFRYAGTVRIVATTAGDAWTSRLRIRRVAP